MAPRWQNDDDDDFDDEIDEDDDDNTVPCPHCGRAIYEDAPRCPYCGRDTSDADAFGNAAQPRMKPLWIVIGSLACMYVLVRWVFG